MKIQIKSQNGKTFAPWRSTAAFTLVEMLLVVTIIGILAALVVPGLARRGEDTREKAASAAVHGSIKTALGLFEVDNGFYPNDLRDLVTPPAAAKNWRGPYLSPAMSPKDPWGNPYIYRYPGKHTAEPYDLVSTGASGKEGSNDNISNWN